MAKTSNYIPGDNPFQLKGPPDYWLRKLADFDDSLVVIPSKMNFVYRLCQKRPMLMKEKIVQDLLSDSDTRMMASMGLIPVTTILSTANWDNPLLFTELTNRSPHRLGGAEKVNKLLEAQDLAKELEAKRKNDQMLTDVARSGWRNYQYKTGQRVSMANHNRGRR